MVQPGDLFLGGASGVASKRENCSSNGDICKRQVSCTCKQELQQQETVSDPMPWLGKLRPLFSIVLSLLPHLVRGVVRRCPGSYRSLSIPVRVVPSARASWLGVWGQNVVCARFFVSLLEVVFDCSFLAHSWLKGRRKAVFLGRNHELVSHSHQHR